MPLRNQPHLLLRLATQIVREWIHIGIDIAHTATQFLVLLEVNIENSFVAGLALRFEIAVIDIPEPMPADNMFILKQADGEMLVEPAPILLGGHSEPGAFGIIKSTIRAFRVPLGDEDRLFRQFRPSVEFLLAWRPSVIVIYGDNVHKRAGRAVADVLA